MALVTIVAAGCMYIVHIIIYTYYNSNVSVFCVLKMFKLDILKNISHPRLGYLICQISLEFRQEIFRTKEVIAIYTCGGNVTPLNILRFKTLKTGKGFNYEQVLTRVGHIPKKSYEGHLVVFFNPQEEIVITSELLQILQSKFTG